MNRQPYYRPPRRWEARLSLPWVRLTRGYRRRRLRHRQRIVEIEVQQGELLQQAVAKNRGVIITPNHSTHFDSDSLYVAADRLGIALYFMTAWQVFAMSSPLTCWAMQHLGAFSVDREGNDRAAFKRSIEILQQDRHPLVVFPEGDIYHTNDVVTPFREGAAAIAVAGARRTERSVFVVPCAIKFFYLTDPTRELHAALGRIEDRLLLRPASHLALVDRVHRLAEAALALKELDYLGYTKEGRIRDRVVDLTHAVLEQLEEKLGVANAGLPPQRVKTLRRVIIQRMESPDDAMSSAALGRWLEDVFFALQLFSYRGDYLVGNPDTERIAETVDKFEEDILLQAYPTVRGERRVKIRFGAPVEVQRDGERHQVETLTETLQQRVQTLIDELNAQSPMRQ